MTAAQTRKPEPDAENVDPSSGPLKLTRAEGRLHVSFKRRSEQTVLDNLFQQGCLKARFPQLNQGPLREGVMINTSGGLTDGDRLIQRFDWGEGASARITGQAAERIYRSRGDEAEISTSLNLSASARGEWLPQETILFDGGRFFRKNRIEMASGSSLVATESTVFGRTLMDEQVRSGSLTESWHIRYDNKLIFADGFHLSGDIARQLDGAATGQGARAMATLIYAGEHAARYEEPVRRVAEAVSTDSTRAACSLLPNLLHIRILAATGPQMRTALLQLTESLMTQPDSKHAAPLPRVWLC